MTRPSRTCYSELFVVATGYLDPESSREFNTTLINHDLPPNPRDDEIIPVILGHGDTPVNNNTPDTERRFEVTTTYRSASETSIPMACDFKENGVSDSDSSLEAPPIQRRGSKWSATILFVTTDVQLNINLAEFSPDEGFQNAPKRVSFMASFHQIQF